METETNAALLDTNVLVYAFFEETEHHAPSRALLDQALQGNVRLSITAQVLTEFYSVVTNPRRVTNPRSSTEALRVLQQLLDAPGLPLLPVPSEVTSCVIQLAQQHPVTGAQIFDVQLVGTMLTNGVRQIYTYNRSHFEVFSEIQVLRP